MTFLRTGSSTLTALAFFVALYILLLQPHQDVSRPARRSLLVRPEEDGPQLRPGAEASSSRELPRCALYHELPANHDDVMAGLAYAFQAAGCPVDVFQKADNYSIQAVMASWFEGRFLPFESFQQQQAQYGIVVFVTFGRVGDAEEPDSAYAVLAAQMAAGAGPQQQRWQQQQQYLGMVHNPAHLGSPRMHRLLRALGRRMRLATIAPSVAQAAQQVLGPSGLAGGPLGEVPFISPVFPLDPEVEVIVQRLASGEAQPANLCIQGAIFKARRNYDDVFLAARHVGAQLQASSESLLLVGAKMSRLDVPDDVQPLIREVPGLHYKEYFALLARCRALMTAFASDKYFTSKASSTIATAMNLGVPLLTEARTQPAYPFLPAAGLLQHASPGAPGYAASYTRALESAIGQRAAERRAMLQAKVGMQEHNTAVARAMLGAASPLGAQPVH